MGEKVEHPITRLRYSGLFDFDGLYAAMVDWSKNYGYKWHEKAYKHKVPSPAGAEQEIGWQITKDIDEYASYEINIELKLMDLRAVEVDVAGKKRQLSSARIQMSIVGFCHYDRLELRDKKPKGKIGQKIMSFFVNKADNDIRLQKPYADTLFYRIENLQNMFKQYFDVQSKKYIFFNRLGEN